LAVSKRALYKHQGQRRRTLSSYLPHIRVLLEVRDLRNRFLKKISGYIGDIITFQLFHAVSILIRFRPMGTSFQC
jgi:hypothetical protein